MPDPLNPSDPVDQLGQLGTTPPVQPAPVEALRVRVIQRRRRRGTIGGALAVTAIAVLAVTVTDSDDDGNLRTTGQPSSTAPSTTTPGAVAPPIGSVLSGRSGAELFVTSTERLRLRDEPTAAAFAFGDGLVVAQAAAVGDGFLLEARGPVLVLGDEPSRELTPEAGEAFTLHDAGLVRGRPVAVVTARTGNTPEDTDERLLLLDLTTGERSDLGSVGGWEAGVRQARLAGDLIVLLESIEARSFVMVRSVDGAAKWDGGQDPLVDANSSIAVVGAQVLWLQPRWEGPPFEATLKITRLELATGALISTEDVALRPGPDLQVDQGFCSVPEWSGVGLLCDRSGAGPIEIDLASGATSRVGALEDGILTVPRTASQADGTMPSVDALCAGLDGTEPVVGDYALTDIPPGFERAGVVNETSTGSGVDMGGETHAILRFSDPDGRWIEFDSFGIESPAAYVDELKSGAAIAEASYQRCVFPASGPESIEYRTEVASYPDRKLIADQEWEYGGFSITGGPGVTVDEMLLVASGLRSAPPPG